MRPVWAPKNDVAGSLTEKLSLHCYSGLLDQLSTDILTAACEHAHLLQTYFCN